MSTKLKSLLAFLIAACIATASYWWVHNEPRRDSLASLTRLDTALHSATDRAGLLDLLIIPAALQRRTAPEQAEFIAKALKDEISPEGLAALQRHGDFGPLKKIFPAEAEGWARQAGVYPEECVAFKLERNGLRAEVVLVLIPTYGAQPSTRENSYRIVRVNNVKQMANLKSVIGEQKP